MFCLIPRSMVEINTLVVETFKYLQHVNIEINTINRLQLKLFYQHTSIDIVINNIKIIFN